MIPKITALFLLSRSVNAEDRINEAKNRLRAVIERVKPDSSIRFMALLNLGILLENSNDDAIDMYTEVIESKFSDEETRACALNNRAYIYQKRKDNLAAVKDREQVLALSKTSPDRRFVALFGCGESHFLLRMYDKVVQDMTAIIESVDILQTDKICALIVRAVGYYFNEDLQASSFNDLELAVKQIIGLVKDQDLQSNLSKLFYKKEYSKSINLLKKNKNNSENDAIQLLRAVYELLAGFSSNNDDFPQRDKWNELRELTISKARRMRIHNPNIPM